MTTKPKRNWQIISRPFNSVKDWLSSLSPDNLFALYSAIVLFTSFFTLFFNYQSPAAPFWDENYHVASSQKYIQGVFFQEPHPPLAKLLIAAGEVIWQPNKDLDLKSFTTSDYITEFPKGYSFVGVRFFPSLLAFLSAYLFFLIIYYLTKNPHLALLFSSFYIFDNTLIVHFRSAMLDSIQMFFILASVAYFAWQWSKSAFKLKNYTILGLLVGLSFAVKVNALILLLLFIFLQYIEFVTLNPKTTKQWKNTFKNFVLKGFAFTASIVLVFGLIQYIHTGLAKNIDGDKTYMASSEYLKSLDQKQTWNPYYTVVSTIDWYRYAQNYTNGVPKLDVCKADENGSYPTNWLIGNKSISYRWERYYILKSSHNTYSLFEEKNTITLDQYSKLPEEQKADYQNVTRYMYLQINPIIWLVCLVSLILSVALILSTFIFGLKVKNEKTFLSIVFFFLIYLGYMISVLTVERVLYLYHYFIPLVMSMILAALNFYYIFEEKLDTKEHTKYVYGLLAAISFTVFVAFVFYAPFSYYLPLSTEEFNARNWFSFWGLKVVQ
jgi:dolichyl-phosphate-mannose-protein mannosyltransferase